jgi:5-methylcytosine-specific restriction protein A
VPLGQLCASCQQRAPQRASARQRGYDAAWEQLRQVVLLREPFCRACKVRESTQVDHILPRRAGGGDELENLQALCASCHSKKTRAES